MMKKMIGIQLSNIVVPFYDCIIEQDGKNVVIIIPNESEEKADQLVTSLGSD